MTADQIHDDERLAWELAQLPDVPAPLSAIDITRAIRDGRRRLRRRRVTAGATVSGLVAAAAAVALLAGGLTGTTAAPNVAPPHTPHAPLTAPAGFGWLPPGFNETSWQRNQSNGQVTEESGAYITDPHSGRRTTWLTVTPEPSLALGKNAYAVTTVNGRRAYWLASGPRLNGWDVMLWWQSADGHWMYLNGSSLPGTDLKQNMLHTAAAYDARQEPLPLPFYLSDTGPGFSVTSMTTNTTDGGATWWMNAEFRKGDYAADLVIGTEKFVDTVNSVKHLNCRTQGGLKACSSLGFLRYGTKPNADDAAWLKQFMALHSITLLDANRRDWTTDVLR
ncbi:hypothetical protein [Streptacidiphilus anmyonensis]|uniref:hypothetical protein n=1 Tax=Streptacidiphilus anmyonensis TaxID=405782 RepID=UPI0005A6B2AA|nr:hypothetical protein [Streptacidiphilus anmyonensis]